MRFHRYIYSHALRHTLQKVLSLMSLKSALFYITNRLNNVWYPVSFGMQGYIKVVIGLKQFYFLLFFPSFIFSSSQSFYTFIYLSWISSKFSPAHSIWVFDYILVVLRSLSQKWAVFCSFRIFPLLAIRKVLEIPSISRDHLTREPILVLLDSQYINWFVSRSIIIYYYFFIIFLISKKPIFLELATSKESDGNLSSLAF